MEIKNTDLRLFLENTIGKPIMTINSNDLATLKTVVLHGENINNVDNKQNNPKVDLSILEQMPNINSLILNEANVTNEDLQIINRYSKIKKLSFNKCLLDFDSSTIISNNIIKLEMNGCYVENYEFLSNIKQLTTLIINNPYTEDDIDLSYISQTIFLKVLVLDRCIITNFGSIANLKNIDYLSLLWTSLPSDYVNIINSLKNLKRLYIPSRYNTQFENPNLIVKNNLNEYVIDE